MQFGTNVPLFRSLEDDYHEVMKNFRVHYSGAYFEGGDSSGKVKRRVHGKVAILGEVLGGYDFRLTSLFQLC